MIAVRIAVCAAALVGAVHCAWAEPDTGSDLFDWCTREENPFMDGVCMGYIGAVFEMAVSSGAICNFDDATRKQIREAIVRYLDTNPEAKKKPAVMVVEEAAKQAFPCHN
jgi:hypothetical protein